MLNKLKFYEKTKKNQENFSYGGLSTLFSQKVLQTRYEIL